MAEVEESWALTSDGGFISDDISLDEALALRASGARHVALPVPSRYRHPRVSEEEARNIAEDCFRAKVARLPPELSFGDVSPRGQDVMRYSFISFCDQWVAAGKIPGGLTFSIDKIDGHVWSHDDFEEFAHRIGLE